MNITVDAPETGRDSWDKASIRYSHMGKNTTEYSTSHSPRTVGRDGFALDISGTVMDNTAYGGHGRTAEDVMQEAGEQDLTAKRNYMAIMSNSMSGKDFAKLQEEGFHPGSMEIETVVTIVDHIKAAMIRGGNEVAGYTDDLDIKKIKEITGSEALARELSGQFARQDIPVTDENAKSARKAWEKAESLTEITEGTAKFMIENKLEPTIGNLYLAQFSGAANPDKQGRGYYADGNSGYFAQKADFYNWETLSPQIEKVVSEAGYEFNDQTLADGKWLIEKGIPLTEEAFTILQQLKGITLPKTAEQTASAITAAIADGREALEANLWDSRSNLEKAVDFMDEVAAIPLEAVDEAVAREQVLTIRNLRGVFNTINTGGSVLPAKESVSGRLLLEETRLKMTVEANLRLLRSGFSIETAPLEELVKRLKEAEATAQMQLTGVEESRTAKLRSALYQETVTKVNEIAAMPASLIGRIAIRNESEIATLNQFHQSGKLLQSAYEKAGESYEAVMTAPRKDLGDSIRKAFRNVDDILHSMDLEITNENQRAVRILGYNRMELTEANIKAVQEKDTLLTEVVKQMKPAAVLGMIRESRNPLTMSLEELQDYFSGKEEAVAEVMEDYSKFLYKLDKKGAVTEEERDAFIGVYRLLRQIEKGDTAAVGALIGANAEFSLKNLLTAVRSSKNKGMDYQVNDKFAGVDAVQPEENSISMQIQAVFDGQLIGRDELQTVLEALEAPDADETAQDEEAYLKEQAQVIQSAKHTEATVIKMLMNHHQPITANHLMAASNMMNFPGLLFRKTGELAKESGKKEQLEKEIKNLHDSFTDKESVGEAYQDLQKAAEDILEESAYQPQRAVPDIRELGMMCRQISLAVSLAREEQYEVPVFIDGELTSINLRIIHGQADSGKVTATISTEEWGRVACEFRIENGVLSGYVACSDEEGLAGLEQSKELLKDMLAGLNVKVGNIHFIQSKNLDLRTFSNGTDSSIGTDNYNEGSSTDGTNSSNRTNSSNGELYLAAKAFIEYFQKSANIIRKGLDS